MTRPHHGHHVGIVGREEDIGRHQAPDPVGQIVVAAEQLPLHNVGAAH